jgi:hypothetical protein
MATQCRVCGGAVDARTRTAGGEVCFDCATAPAAAAPKRADLDAGSWQLAGWTAGDGSGHDGYNVADYFDAAGEYLGADQHGIEPIFEQAPAAAPAAASIGADAEWCPKNTRGGHEPDWRTVTITDDRELYIDVACKHCGRSGCLGSAKSLAGDVQW